MDPQQDEEVTILYKRTVVSNRPCPPGQRYHPSVLDHTMEGNNIRVVLYYGRPPGTKPVGAAGDAIGRLELALSELLCGYPLLTGRLQRPPEGSQNRWSVKLNDVGVRFIEARARGRVEDWAHGAGMRERELKLVHWEDVYEKPYIWSPIYVQVTEFDGGGYAVGLSCTHLLADPACVTALIKSWADITLLGKMQSPPYFQPLPPRRLHTTLQLNRHPSSGAALSNYYGLPHAASASSTNNDPGQQLVTLCFKFDDKAVQQLISEAGGKAIAVESSKVTPFAALATLFWICINRAKHRDGPPMDLSICADVRQPLGLSRTFFGSATVFNSVHLDPSACNYPYAAEVVARSQAEIQCGAASLIEWLEAKKRAGEGSPRMPNPSALVCVDLEHLEPYSATFDLGCAPFRASYYLEPADSGEGQVIVYSLPAAGEDHSRSLGRMVMVTVPQKQASSLAHDDMLRRFAPTDF